MNISDITLKNNEKAMLALRSLYSRYGYTPYKMSKFEEYDLYVRNKDFLISDSVITFTDTNGKLMALKPDVTLSIIKNSKDMPDCVQKVYYDENVYRVSKGTHSFKEIMQAGLECFGRIDTYYVCEVLMLAAKSLQSISSDCVLDVSHLGIPAAILDGVALSSDDRQAILNCIGEKNTHELVRLCAQAGLDDAKTAILKELVTTYGAPAVVLPKLRQLLTGVVDTAPLDQLQAVADAFADSDVADMLRIDFSVVNDSKYYNGIVFKGFVKGVPTGVLSGGQYDKLMQKMHRQSGAIGFAVYLDLLERLDETADPYDVDAVLLYDDETDPVALQACVQKLAASGQRVMAQRQLPEKLRCKQLLQFQNGEVAILEDHA